MVSNDILQFFFSLLYQESGLLLDESKRYLIETRLEPVAAQEGFASIDALGKKLMERNDALLRQTVVDAMTTNETSFFRDKSHFEILRDEIIPRLIQSNEKTKKIRIWCAACSTGQEPYSIGIHLKEIGVKLKDWDIQILATDISEPVLSQARLGVYSQHEVQRGLSAPQLLRYFSKEGLAWKISSEIRNMVQFRKLNLLADLSSVGTSDIIFCRNILIYFDLKTKKNVINKLFDLLNLGGSLFLGGSEAFMGIKTSLVRVEAKKACYYKKENISQNGGTDSRSGMKRRGVCQT